MARGADDTRAWGHARAPKVTRRDLHPCRNQGALGAPDLWSTHGSVTDPKITSSFEPFFSSRKKYERENSAAFSVLTHALSDVIGRRSKRSALIGDHYGMTKITAVTLRDRIDTNQDGRINDAEITAAPGGYQTFSREIDKLTASERGELVLILAPDVTNTKAALQLPETIRRSIVGEVPALKSMTTETFTALTPLQQQSTLTAVAKLPRAERLRFVETVLLPVEYLPKDRLDRVAKLAVGTKVSIPPRHFYRMSSEDQAAIQKLLLATELPSHFRPLQYAKDVVAARPAYLDHYVPLFEKGESATPIIDLMLYGDDSAVHDTLQRLKPSSAKALGEALQKSGRIADIDSLHARLQSLDVSGLDSTVITFMKDAVSAAGKLIAYETCDAASLVALQYAEFATFPEQLQRTIANNASHSDSLDRDSRKAFYLRVIWPSLKGTETSKVLDEHGLALVQPFLPSMPWEVMPRGWEGWRFASRTVQLLSLVRIKGGLPYMDELLRVGRKNSSFTMEEGDEVIIANFSYDDAVGFLHYLYGDSFANIDSEERGALIRSIVANCLRNEGDAAALFNRLTQSDKMHLDSATYLAFADAAGTKN